MVTMLLSLFPGVSHASIVYPKDQPTIEALIEQHKMIKKAEDGALERITASYAEQSLVTTRATKLNDVRTTLDSRLNNAYSYIILAGALATTGTDLYQLIGEYADFTKNMGRNVGRKPMTAWYFSEATLACSREIRNIERLMLTLTASGVNIMKASMDEKLNLIYGVKASIDNMRGIIQQASLWCECIAMGGFHHDYIWDILSSDVTDEIAQGIINNWNS